MELKRPPAPVVTPAAPHDVDASRPTKADWQVNWWLLLITAGVLVVVSPTLYFWREYQVQHNAQAVLDHAKELHAQGDSLEAANWFAKYLELRPYDVEAITLRAQAYGEVAQFPNQLERASTYYRLAIGLASEQADVQELAELKVELAGILYKKREFEQALETAEEALSLQPDLAAAKTQRAKAAFSYAQQQGRLPYQEVAKYLDEALAVNQADAELFRLRADVTRRHLQQPSDQERAAIADALMEQLLSSDVPSGEAHLNYYQYLQAYDLPGQQQALHAALQAAPEDKTVLLAAAANALQAEQWEQAREHAEQAKQLDEKDPLSYRLVATAYRQEAQLDQAIAELQLGLEHGSNIELQTLLVDALLADSRAEQAQDELGKLRRLLMQLGPRLPPAQRSLLSANVDLFRAKLLLQQEKPLEALPILQGLAATMAGNSETDAARRRQTTTLLTSALQQAGLWDQARLTYEAALADQSASPAMKANLATSYERLGQFAEAVLQYQQALEQPDAPPEIWLRLVAVQMRQARFAQGDWETVQQTLQEAQQALPDSTELMLLQAQTSAALGQLSQALTKLDQAVAADPKIALPQAVLFYERWGQPRRADEALRQLQASDDQQSQAVAAELAAQRGDFEKAQDLLQQALQESDDADRIARYYTRLIDWTLRDGKIAVTKELLRQWAGQQPENWQPWDRLGELAARSADVPTLKLCEERLHALEGEIGSRWRFYRCLRLSEEIGFVKSPSRVRSHANWAELERLANDLQRTRPAWAKSQLVLGRLEEQLGRAEEALQRYRQAARSYDADSLVLDAIVNLLYTHDRLDEVRSYLESMPANVLANSEFSLLGPSFLMEAGQLERAARTARVGVELRPQHPLSYLWLGQNLSALSRRTNVLTHAQQYAEEAGEALRKATALAPSDHRTWSALFSYYAQTDQQEEVKNVLATLSSPQVQLSPAKRALLLGQAYQVLRDYEAAEKQFLRAQTLSPGEVPVLQRLANFYLEADPTKAESVLREIIKREPSAEKALRQLALLSVTQQDSAGYTEAINLLARTQADPNESQRFEILTRLSQGDSQNLAKAIELLEATVRRPTASLNDSLLLAQAYESNKQLDQATKVYQQLTTGPKPSPAALTAGIRYYLRQEQAEAALKLGEQLRQLEPNSVRTLQALVACYQAAGREPAATKGLIDRYVQTQSEQVTKPQQQTALLLAAGQLYARYGFHEAAEESLKRVHEESQAARSFVPYALWLSKRGRFDESVRLCVQHYRQAPSLQSAMVLLEVLSDAASRSQQRFPQAEQLLDEEFAKYQNHGQFLFAMATLHFLFDEKEDALALYGQVLEAIPSHTLALNNLALLLSEQPGQEKAALQRIEQAMRLARRSVELRDSKALVLLNIGRADEAYALLEEVIAADPRRASFQLHFAVACLELNKLEQAKAAFERARQQGIANELLTPAERKMIARLEAEFSIALN